MSTIYAQIIQFNKIKLASLYKKGTQYLKTCDKKLQLKEIVAIFQHISRGKP